MKERDQRDRAIKTDLIVNIVPNFNDHNIPYYSIFFFASLVSRLSRVYLCALHVAPERVGFLHVPVAAVAATFANFPFPEKHHHVAVIFFFFLP